MAVTQTNQFFDRVSRNRRINRLKAMRQTGVYAIDTAALITEIKNLHAARKFRNYESRVVLAEAQQRLTDANLQEASFRSNAVATKMKCFEIIELLKEHIKNASIYLNTYYADVLKNQYTTIKARDDAIRFVLEDFYNLQHRLTTVIAMADMLIDDIDQSGYSLNRISNAVMLGFSRERNI